MLTKHRDAFILEAGTLNNAILDSLIGDETVNKDLVREIFWVQKANEIIDQLLLATKQDAQFLAETDPAGWDFKEIILCYPGIRAMLFHRIAHILYVSWETMKARIVSEHSHWLTWIDIHPWATIGHHIAIDHGTWIVIGETSVIWNYVRLYHNVSLGNLSVKKHQEGSKRHPTIEDHVTIYAWAIILWGETTVGHHSTVWW